MSGNSGFLWICSGGAEDVDAIGGERRSGESRREMKDEIGSLEINSWVRERERFWFISKGVLELGKGPG